MYIFDKNGENIDIYSITPNQEKFEKYKRDCITEQIPLGERVWGIETNINKNIINTSQNYNKFGTLNPIDFFKDTIDFQNRKLLNNTYHKLIKEYIPKNEETNENYLSNVLTQYINTVSIRRQLMRVFRHNEKYNEIKVDKYFVLPLRSEFWTLYTTQNNGSTQIKYIDGIVSIPKDLYMLELINQGYYELIDDNITEQLSKFDISNNPIKTISLDELKALEEMGIASFACHNALQQIESSKRLIKHIK